MLDGVVHTDKIIIMYDICITDLFDITPLIADARK